MIRFQGAVVLLMVVCVCIICVLKGDLVCTLPSKVTATLCNLEYEYSDGTVCRWSNSCIRERSDTLSIDSLLSVCCSRFVCGDLKLL